jgi:hypothetical protein
MNHNAIIAAEGDRLVPFVHVGYVADDLNWRGMVYSNPKYVAEWMELLGVGGALVGVQLDMVQDLHSQFWQWLHRFSNVAFDEYGGAQILFVESTTHDVGGPYLPVEAFQADNGDLIVYVPELFWEAPPSA